MASTNTPTQSYTVHPGYQFLLPRNPKGIDFLFSAYFSETLKVPVASLAIRYNIIESTVIEEFRRFLAIKAFTVDENADKISPSLLMDELWHAAILNTKLYIALQSALGIFLQYRPSGASSQENEIREKRVQMMSAIYRTAFWNNPVRLSDHQPGFDPSQQFSRSALFQFSRRSGNPITIEIATLQPKTFSLNVDSFDTICCIKSKISEREGLPHGQQRLLWSGREVGNGMTLRECGIKTGSKLHVVLRHGC